MPDEMVPQASDPYPPAEVENWAGHGGYLRVDKINYHLPSMTADEMVALHTQLATDCALIKTQLEKVENEREAVGSLAHEQREWQRRARFALSMKKKQMAAIHADFARRKTLVPPLEHFALSAVREIYGEIGLGRVLGRARALQDQRRIEITLRPKKAKSSGFSRERSCTDKIAHESAEDAVKALEGMRANGQNVTGMIVYGPCRYCGKYHTGHSQAYRQRQRKQQQRQWREASEEEPPA